MLFDFLYRVMLYHFNEFSRIIIKRNYSESFDDRARQQFDNCVLLLAINLSFVRKKIKQIKASVVVVLNILLFTVTRFKNSTFIIL